MAQTETVYYRLKETTCLGWCGGKTFMQKFPYDRYCVKCTKAKSNLERNLSKREITLSTGAVLPDGTEFPTED
jgi:hypothetical protein